MAGPLPGAEAQHLLAPAGRLPTDLDALDQTVIRKAAVLALFFNKNKRPYLILTLRATYEGVHSGQISLPGGGREKVDRSFMDTALRETHEEIGIPSDQIKIFGELSPLYIPPSNFLVYPFVGLLTATPSFIRQAAEVERILEVDFNEVLNEKTIQNKVMEVRDFKMEVPTFQIDGYSIWGATAMILSELRQLMLYN